MDSKDEFNIPMPEKWVRTSWWKEDEYSEEWIEWVRKKSTWNWEQYQKEWDNKVCPFLGDKGSPCIKCKCLHFEEGYEYEQSFSDIYWYAEWMFKKHKCKLWSGR